MHPHLQRKDEGYLTSLASEDTSTTNAERHRKPSSGNMHILMFTTRICHDPLTGDLPCYVTFPPLCLYPIPWDTCVRGRTSWPTHGQPWVLSHLRSFYHRASTQSLRRLCQITHVTTYSRATLYSKSPRIESNIALWPNLMGCLCQWTHVMTHSQANSRAMSPQIVPLSCLCQFPWDTCARGRTSRLTHLAC